MKAAVLSAARTGLLRSGSRVVRPQMWLATWRLWGPSQAQDPRALRTRTSGGSGHRQKPLNCAKVEEHEKLVRAEVARLGQMST